MVTVNVDDPDLFRVLEEEEHHNNSNNNTPQGNFSLFSSKLDSLNFP